MSYDDVGLVELCLGLLYILKWRLYILMKKERESKGKEGKKEGRGFLI